MDVSGRIRRSIANRDDSVFVRTDFADFGSAAQVSRALKLLLGAGVIVRLGLGVYAKAKRSALTGRPIPVQPLEVLAPEAFRKLGIEVQPGRLALAYNAGETTQVPAGIVLNTGRRRVVRKLSFNDRSVRYERT